MAWYNVRLSRKSIGLNKLQRKSYMQEINITVSGAAPQDAESDAVVVFVPEKDYRAFASFKSVDDAMGKALSAVLKAEQFGGKTGDSLVFHTGGKLRAGRVIVSGLGKKGKWNEEVVR